MPGETDLEARRISVPSIVAYFDGKTPPVDLDVEYHSRSDYINAINKHGAIYKIINFSDCTDTTKLRDYAMEWIRQNYYDGAVSFNVKAVDLHMIGKKNGLGQDYDKLLCGDRIEVEFKNGNPIEFMGDHKYINLNPSSLSTPIDLDSPVTSTGNYKYAIVGCAAGDRFVINAEGGTAPRAYAFLDGGDVILERAAADATLTNQLLVAPTDAVTLVINDKSGGESRVGNNVDVVLRRMTCISAQYDLLKPENSTFKIGIPEISANIKFRDSVNKKASTPTKKKDDTDEAKIIGILEDVGLIDGGLEM